MTSDILERLRVDPGQRTIGELKIFPPMEPRYDDVPIGGVRVMSLGSVGLVLS